MIHFSQKEQCVLMVLRTLSQSVDGVTSVVDIANQYGVTKSMAKQALQFLKERGLVVSREGRRGGFKLAVLVNSISMSDVVGPILPDQFGLCASSDHKCQFEYEKCPIQTGWQQMSEKLNITLSEASVSDYINF